MHVAIIGGGVIGLTTALALRRAGHGVTVLESASTCDVGTSVHNAGWVVPAMSDPVPAPGMVSAGLKMMANPRSPLYIRPTLRPRSVKLLLDLARHCTTAHHQRGVEAFAHMSSTALGGLDVLRSWGVEFTEGEDGLLLVTKTADKARSMFEALGASHPDTSADLLSRSEINDLEPALTGSLGGGVLCRGQRGIDPLALMRGLVRQCRASAVDVLTDAQVVDISHGGNAGRGVRFTNGTQLDADLIVIAAGAATDRLTRLLGHPLPVFAGKGYGTDLPVPATPVRHAVYLTEGKVAVSPMTDRLRLSGTMEIGGRGDTVSRSRLAGIRATGTEAFGARVAEATPVGVFAGSRPMTPDGLPIIGFLPGFDNVVVATGHQMLGVTLAVPTAEAIVEMVRTHVTPESMTPFAATRFTRSGLGAGHRSPVGTRS